MSSEIKPTIREDKVYELRDYLVDAMRGYGGELLKTCLTCMYFDERNEACKVYANQRPPARVIAYGCKSYFAPDEIPF